MTTRNETTELVHLLATDALEAISTNEPIYMIPEDLEERLDELFEEYCYMTDKHGVHIEGFVRMER